ncbi:MAG: signal peptidase II [Patescibacteria group bacterium]|nr:signal peptidase II [Patescibacteria group bacterium]
MYSLRGEKIIWRGLLFFAAIAIDQFTKFCAVKSLLPSAGGFLDLTCNKNIAWSIPLNGFFFFFVWIMAFALFFALARRSSWNVFLVLVLAGSISNIIDRFHFGCVIDYISIGSFPMFNFADILITGGIIAFLLQTFAIKQSQ